MRERLGPFVLSRRLGQGGMGEVWLAEHEGLGVEVAVKTLTAARARMGSAMAAFAREVHAVARLDHPGVIAVFDHGVVGPEAPSLGEGNPYLVMERADGSLFDAAPRSFAGVRRLLLSLLDALAHAHARGVIHRDLKPANVLSIGDHWRLADFGIANALDASPLRARGRVSGTPAYMAPEQGRGDPRGEGPWTDLYALGCVAYELVEGRLPFEAPSPVSMLVAHMTEEPAAMTGARVPIPEGFEAWVRSLMIKHPFERVPRAADAAYALAAIEAPDEDASDRADAISEHAETLPAGTVSVSDAPTLFEIPLDEGLALSRPSRPVPPPLPPAETALRARRSETRRLPGVGLGLYGLREIPLVGRDREREVLFDALAEVRAAGAPRVVILEGASGAGKTRLGQWLAERAHELGAAEILRATHEPRGGEPHGLLAALRRALAVEGLDAVAVAERTLARGFDPDATEDAARLLGSDVTPSERDHRVRLAARLLGPLGRERPLLAWIDDAQWGDEALQVTQEVLRAGAAPVLFVLGVQEEALLARPEERERLDALRSAGLHLRLAPPDRETHADLITALLDLSPELRERVVERTVGNPFFAVQLVGDWVRRGILEPREGGFAVREGAEVDLPDDLHALLGTRIEDLVRGWPEADREPARVAVEVAAALGRTVAEAEWRAVLARLGVVPPADLVAALETRRLAVRGSDDGVWSFAHELLRESVARTAREGGRHAVLHEACAATLEAADDDWRTRDRVGWHLLEAGQPERAAPALLEAAYEAMGRGEQGRARELGDLAAGALDAIDAGPKNPLRAWQVVLEARRSIVLGALDAAARSVREALPRIESAAWRARGEYLLGFSMLRLGEREAARPHLEAALEQARTVGDLYLMGTAHHGLGDAWNFAEDQAAAIAAYEAAADLFRRADRRSALGHAQNGLATALAHAGEIARSVEARARALAIHREAEDDYGVGCVCCDEGDALLRRGQPVEARSHFAEAEAAFARIGSQHALGARAGALRARLQTGEPVHDAVRAAVAERRAQRLDGDAAELAAALGEG